MKSIEDFSKNKSLKDNHDNACKKCRGDYYRANAERKIARQKELNLNRTPEQKEQARVWRRNNDRRLMQDPLHRLNNNLRGNMYHALKALKGFRKWENLVGYTLADLAAHLERQFTTGISWDNYGSEWHVDHIIPKSWFVYTSTDDPKFKECWALTNLQPKPKHENQSKGNRFAG